MLRTRYKRSRHRLDLDPESHVIVYDNMYFISYVQPFDAIDILNVSTY